VCIEYGTYLQPAGDTNLQERYYQNENRTQDCLTRLFFIYLFDKNEVLSVLYFGSVC